MPPLIERLLRLHEGERLRPYRCPAGFLTIGVGRNLERPGGGLSRDESALLLEHDIAAVERELYRRVPWVRALDDVRNAVLLDMAFNLGVAGLLKFRRTLALVEAGDYAGAAGAMLESKWARQVGARARRLAAMMATGRLPADLP